jgi:hypothetical protein
MEISIWKRSFLALLMATAISAQANERDIAAAAKRFFGLQATAVTLPDGKIYMGVSQKFAEIFSAR